MALIPQQEQIYRKQLEGNPQKAQHIIQKRLSTSTGRFVKNLAQKKEGTKSYSASKGISEFAKQFVPQQSQGMMIEDIGAGQQYQSQGGQGRGRGRPNQSFTPKFLPRVGVVRMPVQAYKRALTMQKAKMRLQNELMKSNLSQMPSQNEMPPQDYSPEDAWIMQQQQQQMYPQQQQMVQPVPQYMNQPQRPQGGFGNFMNKLGGYLAPKPAMSAGTGPEERMRVWNNQPQMQQPRFNQAPQNVLNTPGNILNSPNIFNRKGDTRLFA